MSGWPSQRDVGACGTHTRSRDFALSPRPVACLAIRRGGLSCCDGGQKNELRMLRSGAERLVRPPGTPGPGSVERSVSDLPATRHSAPPLLPLRHREARRPRLARRQSVLHPALCELRRPALPIGDDQGRGHGARPRLGHRQRSRPAIHARATQARRHPGAEGHRHRRDLGGQRTRLSHRGERPDPPACDLVRRRGPIRSQHGALIRGHWREKEPRRPGSP